MGRIAFVFSGQGAQRTGMGQQFYEQDPGAAKVFDEADRLRPGTSYQCFHADTAELSVTKNTQPCLFAMEMTCAKALTEAGIKADMAAGYSLGELTALAYANSASFETMFNLVCRRAELMQDAAEQHPAGMVAVLGLTAEKVKELCDKVQDVYPVNFNCPGQVSVSGAGEKVKMLSGEVKKEGGRAVPLKVAGGFHSPFMADASSGFSNALTNVHLHNPDMPVYANRTASPYPAEESGMKKLLTEQISQPVLWENTIRRMIEDGADTFIEIGPGNTLAGMIKRISKDVKIFNISTPEDIDKLKSEAGL